MAAPSGLPAPTAKGPSSWRELTARDPALVERLAFITGDALSPRVREFLDAAGRPFIEKPIPPKDARGLVARLVGSPHAE